MGNCSTYKESDSIILIKKRVANMIDREDLSSLKPALEKLFSVQLTKINDDFTLINNLSLNPLGYALYKGKLKAFEYLQRILLASPSIMEARLSSQDTSGLILLCENNNLDFIEYYLPIFLGTQQVQSRAESVSCFQSTGFSKVNHRTPVNAACAKGNIQILDYLRIYFQGTISPPELDLYAVDDYTRENCGFIASRNGDFSMLKYLHEVANIDLSLLNNKQLNCINVAALSCIQIHEPYVLCIRYLHLNVGIDIQYRLTETAEKARNTEMKEFLRSFITN